MLKKALSIVIAISVISCSFNFFSVADATVNSKDEAFSGRNGTIYEIIYDHPKYPTRGVSEAVAYNNYLTANSSLIKDIEELSYVEVYRFELNKLYVGLPYDSVDKVKSITYIDSIKPADPFKKSELSIDDKYSDGLNRYVAEHSGEQMFLRVTFCYETTMFFVGASKDEYADSDDYQSLKRNRMKAFSTATNEVGFERIAALTSATLVEPYRTNEPGTIVIVLDVDDVKKIAQLDFVSKLQITKEDLPLQEPTESPVDSTEPVKDSATDTEKITKEYLYDKAFESWIKFKKADLQSGDSYEKYTDYDELYYSYQNGEESPRWALIQAHVNMFRTGETEFGMRIGDLILPEWRIGTDKYELGLFIYNVQKDDFFYIGDFPGVDKGEIGNSYFPLCYYYEIEKEKLDEYADLYDALKSLGITISVGDADADGMVTILDATQIQRWLANLTSFYETNYLAADMDLDKRITILDATKIQRVLAGLGDSLDPHIIQTESSTEEASIASCKIKIPNDGMKYHGFAYCYLYDRDKRVAVDDANTYSHSHLADCAESGDWLELYYCPSEKGVFLPEGNYSCTFRNENGETLGVGYFTVH